MEPKEFWIQVSIGNIALWHEKPDWFSHHVIEYSALEAERAKFQKCNEQSAITIRETTKENVAMRKKVKELQSENQALRDELLAAREAIDDIYNSEGDDYLLLCRPALSRLDKFLNKGEGK